MNTIPDERAGLSLWERIIQEPAYLKAKKDLQKRYRLPVAYEIRWNHAKWRKWLGWR